MSRQTYPASKLANVNNASQDSNASSSSAPTATHMHASSIAILTGESLPKIESHFLERGRQQSSFLQRDLICKRLDDQDETRKVIELDSMYQPIRKARIQNRLHLRFEEGEIDLRLYSKPSGKTIDYIDVHNLICVPLECQQESKAYANHGHVRGIPPELDAGANVWQQVIQAMGWEPNHNIIKKGRRFVIHEDDTCKVEALIFQLYKVSICTHLPISPNSFANTFWRQTELKDDQATMEIIADTWILHVSATLPFRSSTAKGGETVSNDASRLSERAQAEIAAIQESLKGLVQLSKEDE